MAKIIWRSVRLGLFSQGTNDSDSQTSSNNGAVPYSSVGRAPDQRFRGPGFEFQTGPSLFSHPFTDGAVNGYFF